MTIHGRAAARVGIDLLDQFAYGVDRRRRIPAAGRGGRGDQRLADDQKRKSRPGRWHSTSTSRR